MINVTWGTGGNIAGTVTALRLYLANITLADDTTITQISHITGVFPENMFISGINLNGKVLKITSSIPHIGDPTVGWKLTLSMTFSLVMLYSCTGTVIIDDMFIYRANSGTITVLEIYPSATSITYLTNSILAALGSIAAGFGNGTNPGGATVGELIAYNNKFLYCNIAWQKAAAKMENLTLMNAAMAAGPTTAGGGRVRNCYASSFNAHDLGAYDHNAAVATGTAANRGGTDGLGGVTNAAAFKSTSLLSSDFGKLKNGSPLIGIGATPSILTNLTDISGNDRPGNDGLYCIGAEEMDAPPDGFAILPSKSGSVSHARVLPYHRGEREARVFHEAVKAARNI